MPREVVEDYYEILEIAEAADKTEIKASYRRLARQQHPDKNPGNPHATAQFQLLNIAHATLIDDTKRHEYNTVYYPSIRSRRQRHEWGDHRGHHTGGQDSTHVRPTAAPSASTSTYYRTDIAALEKKLQDTHKERAALDRDIANINRALRQMEATLKKIDEEEADDYRDEQERIKNTTGIYGHFFGPRETPAEAHAREIRAIMRKTLRLVQRREMETHRSELDTKRINLTTVVKQTVLLQQKIDEARMQEAKLQQKEKERQRAQKQQQQQQQRERQHKADEARKKQREADEAEKKRAAQDAADERWRRRQQEASEKKQAEELEKRWQTHRDAANKIFAAREEQARREAEAAEAAWGAEATNVSKDAATDASAADAQAAKMPEDSSAGLKDKTNKGTKTTEGEKKQKKSSSQSEQTSRKKTTPAPHHQHSPSLACHHQRWWARVEGRQKCLRCHTMTVRFAFQCPDCQTIACADCRTTMKVPTVPTAPPTAPTGPRRGGRGKDGRGGVNGHGHGQGSGRGAGRGRGRGGRGGSGQ